MKRGLEFGPGSLRVIAGSARGRRLRVPSEAITRPTRDAVRENTFNMIGSRASLHEAVVLDLFAGSGAYGLEALSRGARRCTFVEQSVAAAEVVRHNIAELGFVDRSDVLCGSVERATADFATRAANVDVVFADPPYGYPGWDALMSTLAKVVKISGLVIAESNDVVAVGADWGDAVTRRYGTTVVTLWTRALGGGGE